MLANELNQPLVFDVTTAQATSSFSMISSFISILAMTRDSKPKRLTLQLELNVDHREFSFVRWNASAIPAIVQIIEQSQYRLSHENGGPWSRRNYSFTTSLRNEESQQIQRFIVNSYKQSSSRCYKPSIKTVFLMWYNPRIMVWITTRFISSCSRNLVRPSLRRVSVYPTVFETSVLDRKSVV